MNPDSLGTVGRERFEEITGDLYPRMCTNLFATSQQNFEVANYDTAITNLEQVMKMDEGYNDGAAMLLLAQSYEKKGDQDQANVKYQKIIESYPSTDAAEAAQQALAEILKAFGMTQTGINAILTGFAGSILTNDQIAQLLS